MLNLSAPMVGPTSIPKYWLGSVSTLKVFNERKYESF